MGEENQYYIKEHHTAIIEPELSIVGFVEPF